MDERLKFIARLLGRKTGYKSLTRYNEIGPGPAHRPLVPALPPRQPAAVPSRDADRAPEAGQSELGCAKDQGEAGAALSGCAHTDDQYGACGSRSSRPGPAQNEA
jgi:hypothetical protein